MIYSIVIFTVSLAARIYSLFNGKAARYFSLRKGEIDRIKKYFKGNTKKVIWFHSASAGEFEQAKPIIERIRETKGDYLIAASFFSPSGYDAGIKYKEADFCFNLPPDYMRNVNQLLDCINPHLIVYSKYDVWTNLTIEADKRHVSLVLISGTLPEKSFRHRRPFHFFFRRSYRLLKRIYAISEADAGRFKKITGGGPDRIVVSGDTRFDRIRDVIGRKEVKTGGIIQKENGRVFIVAGSTYRQSEIILIDAFRRLGKYAGNVRMVLVPHEIDRENIGRLENTVRSSGFAPVLYSGSKTPVLLKSDEILIVDVFGILAYLYSEADIVFVGGSFKGSVHSVLEPAIFGKPLITGPHIDNSYEALKLKEISGLKVCPDAGEIAKEIQDMINDRNHINRMSQTVKDFFNDNTGAADFIFNDMVKAFLI